MEAQDRKAGLGRFPLATLDGPNGIVVGDNILVATCGFSQLGAASAPSMRRPELRVWTYGLPNGGPFTPSAISGNTVYLGQSGQNGNFDSYNLVAVDLKTGAQRWVTGSCNGNCEAFGVNAPAVDKGIVYTGCSGSGSDPITVTGVCAFDASTGAAPLAIPAWSELFGRWPGTP